MRDPLTDLAAWLHGNHPRYTVADVVPAKTRGYLRCTKPCSCTRPPYHGRTMGWPSGRARSHFHTLNIMGVRDGYDARSPYAFWRAVAAALRSAG